jgi:hypothetical protein
MRGVVALTAALLVSLTASGCFVEEDDPSTQDADATSTTSTTAATTNTTTSTANRSPTANLTATPEDGAAPLNVTFAVGGSDPDGGALDWTLTLGNETLGSGNRTTLPGNVTHQFSEAGNYTVILLVTDGRLNATANVTIEVTAGANETVPGATEDDWAVFNADGTCDAKGEIDLLGEYIHERGDPPGTGYVAGGGTWIYEEANGIDGLQIGGSGEDAAYTACLNPDFLVF